MDMMDELLIDMTLLVEHDDNMTSLVSHVLVCAGGGPAAPGHLRLLRQPGQDGDGGGEEGAGPGGGGQQPRPGALRLHKYFNFDYT